MQHQVDIVEARMHLAELLENALQGQEVVITQDDRPVLKLSPIAAIKPQPIPGRCKGMLVINQEDDAHLDDFTDYMP